jgi:hypothetical protein
VQPGDASGQVRQLVGSMVYAATFARVRLRSPGGICPSPASVRRGGRRLTNRDRLPDAGDRWDRSRQAGLDSGEVAT